ncbi:type VII secretion-associated serine protease mycosin [Streptomyces sp. NPDC051561]|uniref:type VII secretion-associated serine protease mycosin n=1 Tax=Streptomyces sp. NPDC051561 TaxID=3365658 RepID=UPI0037AC2A78
MRGAATLVLASVCPAAQATEPVDVGSCHPGKPYAGRPWPLQRVLLDEVWKETRGAGIKVAVIDTGVDARHPQLRGAVAGGTNVLPAKLKGGAERGAADGTTDAVGHGTKVAGIIAARPHPDTGFVGLAPEVTIIPIDQNDVQGNGTPTNLIEAIEYAIRAGAKVINISQDTASSQPPPGQLVTTVKKALAQDIVVVASAGNDGADGTLAPTYPAAIDGVLAVAASDRNNERAYFSQPGDFVGIAAPGADIVSTVPGGGHCTDSGTSFAAPYVAGVAALLQAKHGHHWSGQQIVSHLQQTAERSTPGADPNVGWGVVDPLRALTDDTRPAARPVAQQAPAAGPAPDPTSARTGETAHERAARLATYILIGSAAAVAVLTGAAVAVRDARRRGRWPVGERRT